MAVSKPIETICSHSHALTEDEIRENDSFTILPARRSNYYKDMDPIAEKLVKDWEEMVADCTTVGFHGTENSISGSFDTLILPEAEKERLEQSVWLTQFFFLLDDKADALAQEVAQEGLCAHVAKVLADGGKSEPQTTVAKLLAPGLRRMLEIDYARGYPILQAWHDWALLSESKALKEFKTIDEYLDFRHMNIGIIPYTLTIEYVMKLTLDAKERLATEPLRRAAILCIALSNDLFSWPKELAAYREGKGRIMNAIVILMNQYNLPITKARTLLRKMIIEREYQLLEMRDDLLSRNDMSDDFRRFVHACVWMVAGNDVWESTCPRYNRHLDFTSL